MWRTVYMAVWLAVHCCFHVHMLHKLTDETNNTIEFMCRISYRNVIDHGCHSNAFACENIRSTKTWSDHLTPCYYTRNKSKVSVQKIDVL